MLATFVKTRTSQQIKAYYDKHIHTANNDQEGDDNDVDNHADDNDGDRNSMDTDIDCGEMNESYNDEDDDIEMNQLKLQMAESIVDLSNLIQKHNEIWTSEELIREEMVHVYWEGDKN